MVDDASQTPQRADGNFTNEELGTLLMSAADFVAEIGTGGTIQRVAGTVEESLGYEKDELAGWPLERLFPNEPVQHEPGVTETPTEFRRTLFEKEQTTNLRTLMMRADGVVVPVTVSPVQQEESVLCVCHCQNDHFDGAGQSGQYRSILDVVGDPMFILDSDGFIEYVNEAMSEQTGYPQSELVGRNMVEIMPIAAFERVQNRLAELISADSKSQTFETTLITNSGTPLLTEATITTVVNNGDLIRSVVLLRDIHDQRRRKEGLDLLKNVFTRVFRHNIRNELMVVQGHMEVLDNEVSDEFSEQIEEVVTSVDNLLSHSRKARLIKEAVETSHRCDVDVSSAASDVIQTAREEYPQAVIDTDLPDTATVSAHPDISRAIKELVQNAIEHAPDATQPKLDIWLSQGTDALTLFVEDASGGLARDEIETLRQGSESDLNHSSGVGLWLVRWLIDFSGADMIVHQTERGSLMGIRFSYSDTEAEGRFRLLTTAPNVDERHPRRFRGETIIRRSGVHEQLDSLYTRVMQKGGHGIFLTGEAGIGKTTVVDQTQERLADRSPAPVVAESKCQRGFSPPYYAIEQLFENLPVETESSDLLEDIPKRGFDDSETAQKRQKLLFERITDQLRELVSDGPVVLVVEDLQWADSGTLLFFEHLVDSLPTFINPLLLVGTCRSGQADGEEAVASLIEETSGSERLRKLELDPFTRDDIQTFLVQTLGIDTVPESLVDDIYKHTAGTPLFVSEIGDYLDRAATSGSGRNDLPTTLSSMSVPKSLAHAVEQRLQGLSQGAIEVLELGAVVGHEIPFDVLRAASEFSVDTLVDSIEELVGHAVWNRSGVQIEFVHGVVREQSLERIPAEQRRNLHARVASAINSVRDSWSSEQASRMGYHCEQAGDIETAFEYYVEAGDNAVAKYSYEDAIKQYDRAVTLAREHETISDTDHAAASATLGDTYLVTGSTQKASTAIQQGLSVAPSKSAVQCQLLGTKAKYLERSGEYKAAKEAAKRQQTVALSIDSQKHEAKAAYYLGRIANQLGNKETARERYEQSLALYRDRNNRQGEASLLYRLGEIERTEGQFDCARQYYEQSLTIWQEIGDREGEGKSYYSLGVSCLNQGAHSEAESYLNKSLDIFESVGSENAVANALSALGNVAHNQGEYDRASELHERSRAIQADIGNPRGEARSHNNLGNIAFERGNYDDASQHYEQSLEIQSAIGYRQGVAINHHNLGNIARARGEYEQAREYYEQSLEIERELGNRRGEASGLDIIGQILARQGEYGEARNHHQQALEINEEIENKHGLGLSLGYLGAVALKQGRYNRAQEYYERAVDIWETIGEPRWEAACKQSLGTISRHLGEYHRASTHLEASLDIAEELSLREQEVKCRIEYGALTREQGNLAESKRHLTEELSVSESDDPMHRLQVQLERARLTLEQGSIEAARTRVTEATKIAASLNAQHEEAKAWLLEGTIARADGATGEAVRHWEAAVFRFESVGAPQDTLETLELLVDLSEEQKRSEQANKWTKRAAEVLETAPEPVVDKHANWVPHQLLEQSE